jgi:predicted metal-binding membrane protein
MPGVRVLERLLKRDRVIALAGLAMLCVLSWLYILGGAGMGMSAWEMTTLSLFPHRGSGEALRGVSGAATAAPAWTLITWALMIAMWWIMMVAMMVPSAAPAILLYARTYRHAVAQGQIQGRPAPTGAFAAGYLLVWLGFSLAATVLNRMLESADLVSAMSMGSQSRWLSGSVLITAGLYQLSPLKQACLSHCRAPASFLARHWRPHAWGALRLGVLHGAYCVGCCWMLMALLFVGGAMNLAWIAALTVLVLAEKVSQAGQGVGIGAGLVLIVWGLASLLV